ncbi:MAG: hypothetical protein KAT04_12395 [Methylococcales bacterium]|nr:hypothetical protein [Methylococcales bacterium]
MVTKSYEVRSEDEGIGNMLLVITDDSYASDEQALKSLWVEAQEFNEQTLLEVIDGGYEKESKGFELKKLSDKVLEGRLKELFNIMGSYHGQLEESPEKSLMRMKEYFSKNTVLDNKVLLLENDFSTYSVFIANDYSKALFSWCDVV